MDSNQILALKDVAFSLVLIFALTFVVIKLAEIICPTIITWKKLDNEIREKEANSDKETEILRNQSNERMANIITTSQEKMLDKFDQRFNEQRNICEKNSKGLELLLDRG